MLFEVLSFAKKHHDKIVVVHDKLETCFFVRHIPNTRARELFSFLFNCMHNFIKHINNICVFLCSAEPLYIKIYDFHSPMQYQLKTYRYL